MFLRFQDKLAKHDLLNRNKKILLAVSGGVDSVVLLDLLNKIPKAKRAQLSIAHVNHQLRAAADAEEQFVKELAQKYSIPFFTYRWSKEDQPNVGIENAARNERYTFFKSLMKKEKISYLMTGHHLDDQTETILMRLTRGASLKQLIGIREKQFFGKKTEGNYLIRPLLEFSKDEIYQYAKKNQLNYVEDLSNKSLDYTRNRYRNEIIPLLKDENIQLNQHIQQFRNDIKDLLEIAQGPIHEVYNELVEEKKGKFYLDLNKKNQYSKALQRALVKEILVRVYEKEDTQYKTSYIELIDSWLSQGEVNSSIDLTGSYLVQKEYTKAIFMKKEDQLEVNDRNKIELNDLNRWIQLSETEYIALFREELSAEDLENKEDTELIISEEELSLPLLLRHRKAGDRMTYKGLKGRKKIKDIFIDDKTPKTDRDNAWLVEDSQGRILWLINHRKRNMIREVKNDKLFYRLKYKRIGA